MNITYNSFAIIITLMGNLIRKGVKELAHFRVVGELPALHRWISRDTALRSQAVSMQSTQQTIDKLIQIN